MNKIIIDPHNCHRDEYDELIKYLDDNSWDWKEAVPQLRFDTPERGLSLKMQKARTFVLMYWKEYDKPPTYQMVADHFNISKTAAYARLKGFRKNMKRNN